MEVSFNGGALWKLATIKISEKPTRSGKHWCWIFWEYTATHEELADANEIVLRGWDEGHQTQPDKPTWNLMGMLNNPWFRVKIFKTIGGTGNTILTFEHPTLAGNQNGGWMPKMREHPALTTPGVYVDPVTLVGRFILVL
jgi:nitrate reductase (NAD(P)H)